MSTNEQEIEQQLTPSHINSKIVGSAYYVFPGTALTVCCLTLENGYHVIGKSAAASIENFDEELGRNMSWADARTKIWELEGYLLKESLVDKESLADERDRKSTRLNSSHIQKSRMPSSA